MAIETLEGPALESVVGRVTGTDKWKNGDPTARRGEVRNFVMEARKLGVPAEQLNPLSDRLYSEAGSLGAVGWTKQAVVEGLKSIPAGGAALAGTVTDFAGITDTGSKARLNEGILTAADSLKQRTKQLAPNDEQEKRDKVWEFFKKDLDTGAYPEGLMDYLSGNPSPQAQQGSDYFGKWQSVTLKTAIGADSGRETVPQLYGEHAQYQRGLYHPQARELLADYIATRDPASWDALQRLGTETGTQWKTRLRAENDPGDPRSIRQAIAAEGRQPNLLEDLALKSGEFQTSPVDMGLSLVPFVKGVQALEAVRSGRMMAAVKNTAFSATSEALSGATSSALEDPRNTFGQIAESGAQEAVGGGVTTGGMAVLGKIMQRFGRPAEQTAAPVADPSAPPDKPASPSMVEGTDAAPAAAVPAPAMEPGTAALPLPADEGDPLTLLDSLLPPETPPAAPAAEPTISPEALSSPPDNTLKLGDITAATPSAVEGTSGENLITPGTVDTAPAPDTVETVTAQAALAADPASTRAAVLITPGTPRPQKVPGLQPYTSPHGLVLFNPRKITKNAVIAAAAGDVFDARALGLSGQPVAAGTTAVTASLPGAPNVQAELVASPDQIPAAMAAAQAAAPGAAVEVKPAAQVIDERAASATVTPAPATPLAPVPTVPGAIRKAGQPDAGSRRVATAAPAPERQSAQQIAARQQSEARARKAEKGTGRRIFRMPPNNTGSEDILDYLKTNRIKRPPKLQRDRLGREGDRGGEKNPLIQFRKDKLAYYAELTSDGGTDIDVLAQDAYDSGKFGLRQPTADALMEKVEQTIANRRMGAESARNAETLLKDQERAAIAAGSRQDAAFRKATTEGPIAASGQDLAFEDVGTIIEVNGEPLTVAQVTEDAVLLEDGDRFGSQWVSMDEIIRIDGIAPPPAAVPDTGFGLEKQTDEDITRERQQQQAATAARDQRQAMERALAAPLTGRDTTGQGALFADDPGNDLFSGPSAQDSLAPDRVQEYTVAHGAHPEDPAQPGLAAALVRSGSASYQQGYLFGDAAPAPAAAGRRGAAGARPVGTGRGVDPATREDAAQRFRDFTAGKAANFDGEGRISSVMAEMIDGKIPGFDIRGKKINNPGDFALLLQPLRTPLFESVKVAVVDEATKRVVHSELIHVGSVNEAVLSPARIVQVLEHARRIGGHKGRLGIIYSHNHPSGNVDPSNADRQMTGKVQDAVKAAGSYVIDHIITNGTAYYSFANLQQHWLTDMELADWESVSTISRPSITSEADLTRYLGVLRQGNGNRGHLLLLDNRLGIMAAEILTGQTTEQITRQALTSAARIGAVNVMLDLAHLDPNFLVSRIARPIAESLSRASLRLVDVASASMDSFRANGLLEPAAEYNAGLDGFVREPETEYKAPAVPEGYDVNRFGIGVQADERIRDAWRATFTPRLYKTFTFEELTRRINAWIGQNGGLEGAAALFLDPNVAMEDYARNALGQVVAQGLDVRARRAEAAGNAAATAEAEAAFDAVINHLETLGTKAGQALAAFRMWGGFSPRSVVRAAERRNAEVRTAAAETSLGTTPEAVVAAAEEILRPVVEAAKQQQEKAERNVVQEWIKKLAESQSDTLTWRTRKTLSALEKLIRAHVKEVNPAFATEAAALGVPANDAAVLDRLVLEEHRRKQRIDTAAAADRLVQQLTEMAPGSKARKAIPKLVEALLKAAERGIITRADFLEAYARAFDLPLFDREFAAAIRQQVERTQAAPEGSWLRQKEQSRLMAMLALHEGIPSGAIWWAYWYANILSGAGTQVVNLTGNATHLLLGTFQVFLTNHPRHWMPYISGMMQGAAEGSRQARAAFMNGEPVMRGNEEWQKQDVLELLWSTDPATWGRKIAKYGAASLGRFVFRALTAADSLFWNTAKEGRAWLEISRRMAKGGDIRRSAGLAPDQWADAQTQAAAELAKLGKRSTRDIDRRAFEIVEAKREAEVTHTARKWGSRMTYNYEPEGTMGAISEVVNLLLQRLPAARLAMPFVRIVANITDVNLDWTPVGFFRAFKGGHLLNSKGEKFTRAERNERYVSSVTGTLGVAALWALANANQGEDDERVPFMIYGLGPRDPGRRSQMPEGWQPFSMKIGGTYIKFDGTPLAFLLGTLGTAMDQQRYSSRRDAQEAGSKAFALLTAAPQTLLNSGVLSGLNQTFEMFSGARKPGAWAERTAASLIPMGSLMKDIATAIDPVKVDSNHFGATFLSYLPVLRGKAEPLLNVFGEPVKAPGPWLISRIITRQAQADPDAMWLTKHGLRIPGLDNDVAVGTWLTERDKPQSSGGLKDDRAFRAEILERLSNGYLTPEERTDFMKQTGPQVRKAITILRHRAAAGATIEQKDVTSAIQAIRRRGMKELIK